MVTNPLVQNHIADSAKKYGVESHEELLDKLTEEAGGKSSANRLKVISRLAGAEKVPKS